MRSTATLALLQSVENRSKRTRQFGGSSTIAFRSLKVFGGQPCLPSPRGWGEFQFGWESPILTLREWWCGDYDSNCAHLFLYCLHIGNIRVFCRVRPLLPTEVRTGDGLDDSIASNDSTSSGGSTSGGKKSSKGGLSSTSLQVDYPDRDNKKIALQFSGTEV